MKARFFLISVIAAMCLCSCNRGPSKNDMQGYLDAMLYYYPYSIEEELVFVNDSLERSLVFTPDDLHNDGVYPETHISPCGYDIGSKCQGDKSLSIDGVMKVSEDSADAGKMRLGSNVYYEAYLNYESSMTIHWYVHFWYMHITNPNEDYQGVYYIRDISPDSVYACMTDTIILTVKPTYGPYDYPDQGYARIVKNKGLTDFSLDGKTIWRRVK